MKAELISIGDELLIGQTVNTNASWLGAQLALINVKVNNCQTISDDKLAIKEAFDLAFKRSDLIIVTGGLGPTKDDITKNVLCEYFDTELEINLKVLDRVESFFKKRNRPMLEVNTLQAALPKACKVIPNYQGTASGMWFENSGKVLVSLPGVPFEMKGMMTDEILSLITTYFEVKALYHRTILITGIGESFLAEEIKDIENQILSEGLSLAYLPSPGIVKLRITSYEGEKDKPKVDAFLDEIVKKFPINFYGFEGDTLASVVVSMLQKKCKTLGVVESCTGGGLASEIVGVSGVSNVFKGGVVSYDEQVKIDTLGVEKVLIDQFGVVSQQVAEQMAVKGKTVLDVDYCLSTTGVAGPSGGTDLVPVGEIWIALAFENEVISKKLNFGDNRERNIKMTIFAALNLLRYTIKSDTN